MAASNTMTTANTTAVAGFRDIFKKMTVTLFLTCFLTALLNLVFGYDTTSFAGVQSIPSFAKQFGDQTGPNKWALSASRASFMSSVAFAGKILGTLTAAIPIEYLGHRWTIWILCVIMWTGIIIECTSKVVAQFVMGRIIVYFGVGVAEVVVTTYQSEIVPATMRGSIVGSIQLFNQFGQIMSSGVNRAYSTSLEQSGCNTSSVAYIDLCGHILHTDGPRWLISKGRIDDAVRSLERVRPKEDVLSGSCRAEAEAIQEALENKVEKGPWLDCFRGTNWRRTWIVCSLLGLQQLTGQGFVSQYSPRFYATVGLSSHAFDYNISSATCGWAGCLIGIILSDYFGRRTLLIGGGMGQVIWLFLIAGLGNKKNPTTADGHALVAGVMLFIFIFTGTWAPITYTIGAELGTAALREKTMSLGISVNVIGAFVVAFAVPYLLNAIAANIGWLFGGIAIFSTIFVFFLVPETKGRSLEELDELLAARVPARKFKTTETFGAGRRVAELENLTAAQMHQVEKPHQTEIEHSKANSEGRSISD